ASTHSATRERARKIQRDASPKWMLNAAPLLNASVSGTSPPKSSIRSPPPSAASAQRLVRMSVIRIAASVGIRIRAFALIASPPAGAPYLPASLVDDGRAVGADHQHRAALTQVDRLVVQVHTNHRVRAELRRLLDHLFEGDLFRLAELLLVSGGAPAHDVADAREEVAEDVGAEDRVAAHQPQIPRDLPALDRGRRHHQHDRSLPGGNPVAVPPFHLPSPCGKLQAART